jgi:hypothetical protein
MNMSAVIAGTHGSLRGNSLPQGSRHHRGPEGTREQYRLAMRHSY